MGRSDRQDATLGPAGGKAGHGLRQLTVHFICNDHHVRQQQVEVHPVGVCVQCVKDADLQATRFLDQDGGGVALVQSQESMRCGGGGYKRYRPRRDGIAKTTNELAEKFGQVGRSGFLGCRCAREQLLSTEPLIPVVNGLLGFLFENCGDALYRCCRRRILSQWVIDKDLPAFSHRTDEPVIVCRPDN